MKVYYLSAITCEKGLSFHADIYEGKETDKNILVNRRRINKGDFGGIKVRLLGESFFADTYCLEDGRAVAIEMLIREIKASYSRFKKSFLEITAAIEKIDEPEFERKIMYTDFTKPLPKIKIE